MNDSISRQAAIDAVHSTIFDFFETDEDDSDSPMTDSDKRLLELNKAISTSIRGLPSAVEPEWEELLVICDVCGHAIRVKRN